MWKHQKSVEISRSIFSTAFGDKMWGVWKLHKVEKSFPHYSTNIPHLSVDNFYEEKGKMTGVLGVKNDE